METRKKIPLILTPFYILFLLGYLAVTLFGDSLSPDTETIFVACGLSGDIPSNGRTWVGDLNSKFSPLEPQQNSSRTLSNPRETPYSASRLSHAQFTYTFNLTSGQKFIRLHFCSTSYAGFNSSSAFFSVKAGSYTLLSNFSVSLTAEGEDTFMREFCINVEEDQSLVNITFTPSPDYQDSYAFISGIEVVSMPPNLYYTAVNAREFTFVGQGNQYSIQSSNALANVYRINVGGQHISPSYDTGMYRTWTMDDDYLTDARPSALPVNINHPVLTFSQIHNYSAPAAVYNTARTMGRDKNINENYNLTWEFEVDSGFTYFLRLHFCEFQSEITKVGDRVLEIYIADIIADAAADIISWSGGNGFPIYKDYAVMMGSKEGNEKKQNLSIKLHPAPEWRTLYSDAILNGLEIFKVDNAGNLAGSNPEPRTNPSLAGPPSPQSTKSKSKRATIIGIVAGVVSGFVVLSLLFLFIFRRVRKVNDSNSSAATSLWGPFLSSTTKSTKCSGSALPSELCTHFSLSDIKAATNNLHSVLVVGVGGFGNVYKGFMNGSSSPVAIKRLNPGSHQGAIEFHTEIGMLSQLRHLHLVSLIGYCNDEGEMILVYDFMSRGTLRDHLYNSDSPPLPWNQRLEICIGAARGLHYLHTGTKHVIIHRDVKTANILLDEKWVAKVSDFGLSKFGPTSMSKTHVSTAVKGSFGYLDPEYYRLQQLTEKSDVYSFGVVLFEVLCARPPIIRTGEKMQVNLAVWAQQCCKNGTIVEIVDPFLKGKIKPECLNKFAEVAMSCLNDNGTRRPSMNDVVWGLEFALQLQGNAEENGKGEIMNLKNYETDDSAVMFSSIGDHVMESRSITTITISTGDDQSFSISKSSDSKSQSVFSEIMNPQER